jgi:hypothetical protein
MAAGQLTWTLLLDIITAAGHHRSLSLRVTAQVSLQLLYWTGSQVSS